LEIRRLPSWTFAIAAALLVAVWQWATVNANYAGNWTALFRTGALQPQPPELAGENIYRFAGSTGYDGQFYHYIAHDPLMRTSLAAAVDNPRFRYRRILVPALAYGLALGRTAWVDRAYEAVCLLAIALGVWWSCRFADKSGLAPAWGLLFLLLPAVPITADRMVVDAALAALAVAFLLYVSRPSWKLFVVLSCAALVRETGFLLIAGYCGWLLWRRQWRGGCIFLLSAVPALAWYGYVQVRTAQQPIAFAPFRAILDTFRQPLGYPAGTPLAAWVSAADYLALAGLGLAFLLAIARFANHPRDPVRIAALLFVVTGLILRDPNPFRNVYDFGRVYTPLLLCLQRGAGCQPADRLTIGPGERSSPGWFRTMAVGAVETRGPVLLAPVLLMLPRIGMQFAPQVLGVTRWLAR